MTKQPAIKRFGVLVGASPKVKRVYNAIAKAAKISVPVLLVGETGTGKELVAQEIHARSPRRDHPFVAVNMGAVSSELVASELFGHVKGAFTGAVDNRVGCYEEAQQGTLFLDEITTMEERVQVALLRVIESGTFRPIGAKQDKKADVRLIAATNVDLRDAVHSGIFREDLLHRFQVLRIKLPPLREHPSDIPMLAYHFLDQFRKEFEFKIDLIEEDALQLMQNYRWPGNSRELKNVIAQAAVMAEEGSIRAEHLPYRIRRPQGAEVVSEAEEDLEGPELIHQSSSEPSEGSLNNQNGLFVPVGLSLENVQKSYVLKTLEHCSQNKTLAANMLGVSRKALYDKLQRWGVSI
ncbi:MAG: sigma-54-dependent Fis family transcriptional regulator [Candidatus Hydrogenedentes bacterium]|nr:sigma-54-dependent Fis family transcriptional regulator [Candidatus Hydrogenedentota bacterium]MBI3117524.1 sigma-54-dependent Fis family transcriptional regulator [Candidatus Hydrogenedentota bacterium]